MIMVRIDTMPAPFLSHHSEVLELQEFQTTDTCVEMILRVQQQAAWTDDFPQTTAILEQHLPSVLNTQCFNEWNLPFAEEVEATSMGHLFEHIALDYLCYDKVSTHHTDARFKGHTRWNWEKFPEGSFLVCLEVAAADQSLLLSALPKTIYLTEQILRS